MQKKINEWFIDIHWGKVAMVSWGDSTNPPVLLVHGYMDTAATFIPLLNHLPDTYYYVGFDIPGHGKSEPFPAGPVITQLHVVEVVRKVVEHMKWESFIYVAHSMACIIGLFYNHIYPGKITKIIHLDPAPAISVYYYPHHKPKYWFQNIDDYYTNYESWNSSRSKTYTYDEAIDVIMRSRSLSNEQAEAVISRSLVAVGDGTYKFSWETRMKKMSTVLLSEDNLFMMFTQKIPPSVFFEASENRAVPPGRKFAKNILEKCKHNIPENIFVTVPGGHDFHITNPEFLAPYINEFLKLDVKKNNIKCKL